MTPLATTASTPTKSALPDSLQPDSAPPDSAHAKLATAAKQFEAIFVRQMLAAARKTDFGDDLFSSEGMNTFRQLQDENFADLAAKTGTLDMAEMIQAQLARHLPKGL